MDHCLKTVTMSPQKTMMMDPKTIIQNQEKESKLKKKTSLRQANFTDSNLLLDGKGQMH